MQRPGHVLGIATWSVSPKSGDTLPVRPWHQKAKGLSPDHPFSRGELLVLGSVWESYELFNFCLSCLMSLLSHGLLVRHPFLVQRLCADFCMVFRVRVLWACQMHHSSVHVFIRNKVPHWDEQCCGRCYFCCFGIPSQNMKLHSPKLFDANASMLPCFFPFTNAHT